MVTGNLTRPTPTHRLRVLRAERRLTQADVYRAVGMGQTRYWQIENGYREATAHEQAALAAAFGVAVSRVFPKTRKAVA